MMDPEILDRILQACSYRFRNIVCPNREKMANIVAASFQAEETDWTVIECSLESNGNVKCGMTCLLKNSEQEN
ncbi:MAG TPA: hypothetical protein VKB48_11065 [Candidatus Acidoferrum sp.]|nr:hypothetical protein [Candidatus Acidoferrum sp.]